jgi:acetyl-CoA synthetase
MSHRIRSLLDYSLAYQQSIEDPSKFWGDIAESFTWRNKWDEVVKWNFEEPNIKWFTNAKLNITENIFERHLAERGNQPAIIWEPNDPQEDNRILTYKELHEAVCIFSNALIENGLKKGDRVVIYMPMIPETAVAMLACARVGAIHSVVFAGFSAQSLADRINDSEAVMVLTSDGNYRGKKDIGVKSVVDEALEQCTTINNVIVCKRTGTEVNMVDGRDIWWHDAVEGVSSENTAAEMDSEDMLFILYTSGSTGKPKGVVHTCGGYMIYTQYSFENVFQYDPGDIYWCTADVGWVTGHSYIVYGPLLAGATTIMFEGVPTYPDPGRFWAIVDKYKVNQFYTAPTAIRALQAFGDEPVQPYSLDSLKVIGTVGEPINEEAWNWYHTLIGKNTCPIVDTWWQTETGGIMISPLGGITPTKPAYATLPLPGVELMIVDGNGQELKGNNVQGNLCIKSPWPSILRTTYGDHDRCKQTYFATFPGLYFTGDGVKRDEDGYYRILGRVDDVINVSGHRLGTAEVENAINEHPQVTESAVVGYPHEIKGQGIYAYVICDMNGRDEDELKKEIRATVSQEIGPIAKPDVVQIVPGLPKTRSGKIMRRILRKVAGGDIENLGDTSTLLNPEIVKRIIEGSSTVEA